MEGLTSGRGRRPQVTSLLSVLREAQGGQRLLLSTLQEGEYEFVSPSSVAIAELVAMFLEGLKERSVFAMALQDRKATGADQQGGARLGKEGGAERLGAGRGVWEGRGGAVPAAPAPTKPWVSGAFPTRVCDLELQMTLPSCPSRRGTC